MSRVVVSRNLDELSTKAADEFARIAKDAINLRGQFTAALSGGSTPRALFQKLVSADLDWNKLLFFFGDERNVPADDEQSNFRMANETLFEPLGIGAKKVFRWKTELPSREGIATDYTVQLESLNTMKPPGYAGGTDLRFDLVLLGMGTDGHTASLFPNTIALKETEKLAVANWVPQLDAWRYTLTFPVINNARNVMFLVSGGDKAETLKNVLEGERRPDELPAQSVNPTDGELFWFVDEAAASLLEKR